ncbi:lysylphosphatidylglycerol synthase transmembrane domain-containing protein [Pseudodesulfovibrio methanolicus]|uniref:Lysylphosphatidylglycerol synthase transmembrane domain-containing protein n=1 Tax=Pseudodesulfovibrio methanolicus TaxID=3126690 RepID=A0ABZ2ITQ4_9BACT
MKNNAIQNDPQGRAEHGNLVKMVLFSLLGSVVLLAVVAWSADLGLLRQLLSHVDRFWLGGAAACMVVLQCVSGLRLATLLPDAEGRSGPMYASAVEVAFLCQALIKILPFRLGEVAFFWLAKMKLYAPFDRTLGVFLRFRLWDLRVMAISFILCAGWVAMRQYAWLKVYIGVAGILGVAFFLLSPVRILSLADKVFRFLTLLPGLGFLRSFSEMLEKAVARFDEEQTVSGTTLLMQSVVIWAWYFIVIYCLIQSLGIAVGPVAAIAVASGMTLVGIVPLQTVGGLGLVEIGQASLYMLAGLPVAEAASSSLAVSVLFLMLCIVVPGAMWALFAFARLVSRRG